MDRKPLSKRRLWMKPHPVSLPNLIFRTRPNPALLPKRRQEGGRFMTPEDQSPLRGAWSLCRAEFRSLRMQALHRLQSDLRLQVLDRQQAHGPQQAHDRRQSHDQLRRLYSSLLPLHIIPRAMLSMHGRRI